jgi:serine/threonine protein phosphatase PrpC
VEVVCHRTLPIAGVVVADGLGSQYRSDVGSSEAARALAASIEAVSALTSIAMPAWFGDARMAIENVVSAEVNKWPDNLNLDNAFGTTLLCGLDLPERLLMAYVGNGALIHLRADFDEFPPTLLLPWTAANCLNPHSLMAQGTDRLYKWLGPRTSAVQSSPTVVEVAKDNLLYGDILIICSDGITSLDHTQVGLDAQKQMWMRADDSVAILYWHLRAFIATGHLTSADLRACLERYLDDLDAQQQVADDCTIGVIVTSAALRYYEGRGRKVEAVSA